MKLSDIIQKEEVIREICRAGRMSHLNELESGFNIYCGEDFLKFDVNSAVLGGRNYIETDMTQNIEYEKDRGAYIPKDHYRMINTHFHPPRSLLIPSKSDIDDCLKARIANINIRDLNVCYDRMIFDNKEKTKFIGYEMDYINPLSIIGLIRDRPDNIELLIYQSISDEPIEIIKFSEFVSKYCNNLYGREYSPSIISISEFPVRFSSTKRAVKFLNESEYIKATDIKIKDGNISKGDLKKLKGFDLIQTKFFHDQMDITEDSDIE